MSAAGVVGALLLVLLGMVILAETMMSGVGLAGALPVRVAGWRLLGPFPLLATVWLVVLLAWLLTGFPTTENLVWSEGWIAAGLAVLAAAGRLALVLLAPLLTDRASRFGLAVISGVALTAWPVLAVQVGGLPAWQAGLGGGVLGVLALIAGWLLTDPARRPNRSPADRPEANRPHAIRPGALVVVGLAVGVVVVVASGLDTVSAPVLAPSAEPGTLRLLAIAGLALIPLLIACQILTVGVLRGASADWARHLGPVPPSPVPPSPVPSSPVHPSAGGSR